MNNQFMVTPKDRGRDKGKTFDNVNF